MAQIPHQLMLAIKMAVFLGVWSTIWDMAWVAKFLYRPTSSVFEWYQVHVYHIDDTFIGTKIVLLHIHVI